MRGVRWVSISVVLLPFFQSLTRDADAFLLSPLPQGANHVTPRKDTLGQECICNTVAFRYEIDPSPHCMRSLDTCHELSSHAQIVYGVHHFSECHHSAVFISETVFATKYTSSSRFRSETDSILWPSSQSRRFPRPFHCPAPLRVQVRHRRQ